MRTKMAVDPAFPLRGYLLCPHCGKQLTASTSKGRNQYYSYYHCNAACGFRHTASEVNDMAAQEISRYVKPLPALKLYKERIVSIYKEETQQQRTEIKDLELQLEDAHKRLTKARDLLLSGDIEPDDYRTIKSETDSRINRMEARLTACAGNTVNIEPLLDSAISNLSQLDKLYSQGTVNQQRKIIGSIFPEKLTFDGNGFRTARVNQAIVLMLLITNKIEGIKKGQILLYQICPKR
jgi:site-specific DNA recombinase